MKQICLIFALYEKNDLYKEGIEFFIQHAILDEIDYYFVVNGETSVEIPDRENITVLRRKNEGFDFGAWSYGLRFLKHKKYLYYFFANSSVTGPYMENKNIKWYIPFIDLFKLDIYAVGTGIDTMALWMEPRMVRAYGDFFVEKFGKKYIYATLCSAFFCLNIDGLRFLESIDFFNEETCNTYTTLSDVIFNKEIAMSQYILNGGKNIDCLIRPYKGIDYRLCTVNLNKNDFGSTGAGSYFTHGIKPEHVIFYKYARTWFVPKL